MSRSRRDRGDGRNQPEAQMNRLPAPRDQALSRQHPRRHRTSFMRLIIGLVAPLALAIASAQPAAAEDKPVISTKTKAIEATVTIDSALKAHPGLYQNLLAEARRQVARWRVNADKEMRESPEFFKQG